MPWHRLSREVLGAPGSLTVSKAKAGCGSESPGIVEGVPTRGRGLELDDL